MVFAFKIELYHIKFLCWLLMINNNVPLHKVMFLIQRPPQQLRPPHEVTDTYRVTFTLNSLKHVATPETISDQCDMKQCFGSDDTANLARDPKCNGRFSYCRKKPDLVMKPEFMSPLVTKIQRK